MSDAEFISRTDLWPGEALLPVMRRRPDLGEYAHEAGFIFNHVLYPKFRPWRVYLGNYHEAVRRGATSLIDRPYFDHDNPQHVIICGWTVD